MIASTAGHASGDIAAPASVRLDRSQTTTPRIIGSFVITDAAGRGAAPGSRREWESLRRSNRSANLILAQPRNRRKKGSLQGMSYIAVARYPGSLDSERMGSEGGITLLWARVKCRDEKGHAVDVHTQSAACREIKLLDVDVKACCENQAAGGTGATGLSPISAANFRSLHFELGGRSCLHFGSARVD